MAEITVAGKQVTLVDRFPAAKFHPLLKALRAWDQFSIGDRAPEEEMAPYVGTVTAWGFAAGDPAKLESWLELDVFTEWPPLLRAINSHLGEAFNAVMSGVKN